MNRKKVIIVCSVFVGVFAFSFYNENIKNKDFPKNLTINETQFRPGIGSDLYIAINVPVDDGDFTPSNSIFIWKNEDEILGVYEMDEEYNCIDFWANGFYVANEVASKRYDVTTKEITKGNETCEASSSMIAAGGHSILLADDKGVKNLDNGIFTIGDKTYQVYDFVTYYWL